ncbi:MAG: tetratricopeptide repeat protein [Verrucomicrobia bacterium]|nr:tetratricopeptide repeat protein [Verrucomicrobiota bacterium]
MKLSRCLLLVCVLALLAATLRAANPPLLEEREFRSARRSFEDNWFDRAEREFADFLAKYPAAIERTEAVLMQARSRFEQQKELPEAQRNFSGVVELLQSGIATAGEWAPHYGYWIAEAHFEKGDYAQAAAAYEKVIRDFPQSEVVLNACLGQALAKFKQGDLTGAANILRRADGAFAKAASAQPNDKATVRARLLLAEVLFTQSEIPAAVEVLNDLSSRPLASEQKWKHQFLLARSALANQQPQAALAEVTNLLTLASAFGSRFEQAQTLALQADVLEQLNERKQAIAVLTNNLAEAVPASSQQQALVKIVELTLADGQISEAIQWLETLLARQPPPGLLDLARLTLGELRLKQYFAAKDPVAGTNETPPAPATNLLALAQAQFTPIITNSPPGMFAGQAYLNRGWCWWEQGVMTNSAADFQKAAELLPASENHAVALFKWADAQLAQKNFSGAITNYRRLVDQYVPTAAIKNSLLAPALYQIISAASEIGDQASATNALDRLLSWFPEHELRDRSVLITGKVLTRQKQPAEARLRLEQFLARFTNSILLADARLAIARTFVQEENWPAATKHYDAWAAQFTNHVRLPEVEFDRGWLYYQARQETNALALFTNFVARFPAHVNVPLAQNWIGDYFLRQRDYVAAEKNFQALFQGKRAPLSELAYEAQIKAAAAALARPSFDDAIAYFTNLINNASSDSNCPPRIIAEAWFGYGDTLISRPTPERVNPLGRFERAINVFNRIVQDFPTNALAPLALGRIADCHFQLGGINDPTRYDQAATNYFTVMNWPQLAIGPRSEAEVGLAAVLEKQAVLKPEPTRTTLLSDALNHCLNVFYGKNLRAGERASPFWTYKAGSDAARIAEAMQRWRPAFEIYRGLLAMPAFPSLRPSLEKKLEMAKSHLTRGPD